MITIDFEINGRKVRPDQFGSEIEKVVLQGLEDEIRRNVRGIVCPIHGERPKIVCKGRQLDDLSIDVYGCCDELANAVTARL